MTKSVHLITWLLTLASLAGVVLNVRLDRRCFYVWTVTNACWAVIDWRKGLYAQAVLFAVYFALAIYGVYEWKRREIGRQAALESGNE